MFKTTGAVSFDVARTSWPKETYPGLPYDHAICGPFAQKEGLRGLSSRGRPLGYSTPNAGPAAGASANVLRPAAA